MLLVYNDIRRDVAILSGPIRDSSHLALELSLG
jgi:hypothetical protein